MKKRRKRKGAIQYIMLSLFLISSIASFLCIMCVASAWDAGIDTLPLAEGTARIMISIIVFIVSGSGIRHIAVQRYNDDKLKRQQNKRKEIVRKNVTPLSLCMGSFHGSNIIYLDKFLKKNSKHNRPFFLTSDKKGNADDTLRTRRIHAGKTCIKTLPR